VINSFFPAPTKREMQRQVTAPHKRFQQQRYIADREEEERQKVHYKNDLSFCGDCGGCKSQCRCSGSHSGNFSSIRPDDGSRMDSLRYLASVVNGSVNQPTATFTITPAQGSTSSEFQLAPLAPNTLADLNTEFGFNSVVPTKVGDLVAIAGLLSPDDVFNTIFEVTGLPSAGSPWYVLRRYNPFSFQRGLRVGDYLLVYQGTSAAIYQIATLVLSTTLPVTTTWTLVPTNYSDVNLFIPLIVEPPCQKRCFASDESSSGSDSDCSSESFSSDSEKC
jgi:hypothetical protein